MKVLFTTILFFVFSTSFSQVSDTIFNQRNARGLEEGVWKRIWTETGKIAAIEIYKNGVRHGFCKYYWENGNLQSTGFFIGNSVEGEFRSYYKSGVLYEIKNFKDDVREGLTTYYDTLGKLASQSLWKDGRAYGLFKTYEEGRLKDSAFAFEFYDYANDWLVRQEYYDSAMKNLRIEYFYSDKRNGGERPFKIKRYSGGTLIKEENF